MATISVLSLLVILSQLPTALASATTLSRACQKSAECQAAIKKQQEANSAAAAATDSANAYQIKVNELNAEIYSKEAEIAATQAEIEELNETIAATEKELASDQEALASMLIDMHFEDDSEPIRILASSSSISDLAEKQAREEVVKSEISAAATKVKEMKIQLEKDRTEVENLLAQQQDDKQLLESSRLEMQNLVAKYENDADAYAAAAEAAKQEAQLAAQKYQEEHPEEFSGTASSYTGYNTYPWQEQCPARQDDFVTYWDGYKIGGYVCECVSYAGWKAYEAFGVAPAWGNAYDWGWRARNAGYRVDNTPAANTIGQTTSGPYGHVFWVESVNSDGSINVTEYNNAYATWLYSGISRYGDFGSRTISASQAGNFNYIHFE